MPPRSDDVQVPDCLQGDNAIEADLPCLVDDTHPALTQEAQDLVARNRREMHPVSSFLNGDVGSCRGAFATFLGGCCFFPSHGLRRHNDRARVWAAIKEAA